MKLTNEKLEKSSHTVIILLSLGTALLTIEFPGVPDILKLSVGVLCFTIAGLELYAMHIHRKGVQPYGNDR